jgi:alpha-1,6-mannosyltransferase
MSRQRRPSRSGASFGVRRPASTHRGYRARRVWAALSPRHRTAAVAAAGFVVSALIVVAGGRTGTVRVTIPLTTWFGLLTGGGYQQGESIVPGVLLITSVAALALLWLWVARGPHPATSTETRVWAIAGAWALPLVVGPPLLSSDVYTYAAQGQLVSRGLDPYTIGPAALGNVPATQAVDPAWRNVPSPYGPLATWLEHEAALLGGGPLGAVVVLRLVAVASVAAIGVLAASLAGTRRIPALTLTVLNPLVLLQIVSPAHLEGALCALLLGALLAARRGSPRLAVALACAAGAVKAPALLAVPAIIAWQRGTSSGRAGWLGAARDSLTAAVACTGLLLLVPHGWGWLPALTTPTLGYTAGAPASLLGDLLHAMIPWASFDDLAAAGRVVALLAAGCIVVYLVGTVRRRALELTVGLSLLAIALLSPVIYPWYLLWGLLCLAPITRGLQRSLVLLACASASVLALPGLPGLPADLLAGGFAVLAVILLVATGDARVGLAAAVATARRTARGRRPAVRSGIERTPR